MNVCTGLAAWLMAPDGTRPVRAGSRISVGDQRTFADRRGRGSRFKWAGYQRIGSLTDYLLVAQAETRIEHYRRNADGLWTYRAVGPGEHVALTGGGERTVDAIYAGMFDLPGE